MPNTPRLLDAGAEEAASLFVLGLLPSTEVREFEDRLHADPALRELVRELQGNLDAMVLDAPVRPAPLHVWGHIAAEVSNSGTVAHLAFPKTLQAWIPRLLAAAACLILGAFLHSWFASPASPSPTPIVDVPLIDQTLHLSPPSVPVPSSTGPMPRSIDPTDSVSTTPISHTNKAPVENMAQLRERVRVLATQVAALNQVLTQQANLPSGFTRLHVFRLVNTNSMSPQNFSAEAGSLADALAALATGRRPGSTSDPNTPPLDSTEDSPSDDLATNPAELVASGSAMPLNGGQPLGFFDPETGRGAIALFDHTAPENHNFVVWAQTTGAVGDSQIHPVGVAAAGDYPTVISFNSPAAPSSIPSFFVTLEPVDSAGMATPTGPVVAGPPVPTP